MLYVRTQLSNGVVDRTLFGDEEKGLDIVKVQSKFFPDAVFSYKTVPNDIIQLLDTELTVYKKEQ